MRYYIYILKSNRDGGIYIGHATNVALAMADHEAGGVRDTKYRLPVKLIHKEFAGSFNQVRMRERYWKSPKGEEEIIKLIGPIQRWKNKYEYRNEKQRPR